MMAMTAPAPGTARGRGVMGQGAGSNMPRGQIYPRDGDVRLPQPAPITDHSFRLMYTSSPLTPHLAPPHCV